MTIIEKKSQLQELWEELTKEEPYAYYEMQFYNNLAEEGKIGAIAFRFPTFEEMCCKDPYIEEEKNISGNVIHIIDMRIYLEFQGSFRGQNLRILNHVYEDAAARTKEDLVQLFKTYFNFIQKKPKIDIYSTLTPTEKVALKGIYQAIGLEGEISISKLIKNVNASRITFNSLLNTLSTHQCAEVVSRGVKGTYIKFIDPILIAHLPEIEEK